MTRKKLEFPPDVLPPSRYVEKVSLLTGEVLEEEILPKQLLIHHHRDFHILDVYSRYLVSRAVQRTGKPELVVQRMKAVRRVGQSAIDWFSTLIGDRASFLGKKLFGFKSKEYYFRYRQAPASREGAEAKVEVLRSEAKRRLDARRKKGRLELRVLLTGGTGFLGKEIIAQAADDPEIAEMVVLIREKEVRDRKTKQVIKVISPEERGQELLRQLWLQDHPARGKFRFLSGDIEKPDLGIAPADKKALKTRLTHLIHCAASVSFDDTYENSFRANVLGSLNALRFSKDLRDAKDSPFVFHVGIETSYIHGRQAGITASEEKLVFPRNFFNNYYELTKAMGSLETDRFMLEHDLPVTQLCPSIVVGDAITGNNRGDTKVVNAPVNAFGRAKQAFSLEGSLLDRSKAYVLASVACVFPGDPSAELNLVPVDRVVQGILSALGRPAAVGTRVHLATDNRLTSAAIQNIAREEIGVAVKLAEPTIHRTVTLPLLTKVLTALDQPKLAGALRNLGTIFGSYSEWGQPVHEVGNDVDILGLPLPRPNTEHVFRMVCRHNRYVQDFGQVKDLDEISRRELHWRRFILSLQERTGQHVGQLSPELFRDHITDEFDLDQFVWKGAPPRAAAESPDTCHR